MARVAFEHVSKTFTVGGHGSVEALRDVSFMAEAGELLAVVGPSGSGKTTLLRLFAGLEQPSAGVIRICDAVMNGVEPQDRDVAMVFQQHALYPHLSVFENLALGLRLRKFARSEIEARVRATADLLELTSLLGRLPSALSGGERQRAAVGRAIVRQPRVFLLDEPLASLDAPLRAQLRAELRRLHQRLAATMIFVTHDQSEALALGQRVVVLRDGAIQQIAPPSIVYRQPANLFVAGFIGVPPMNLIRGRLVVDAGSVWFEAAAPGLRVALPGGDSPTGADDFPREVILGFRPEHVLPAGTESESSSTVIEAAVESVEEQGATKHVHLAVGAHRFMALCLGRSDFRAGQRAAFALDLANAHFFDPGSGCRWPGSGE